MSASETATRFAPSDRASVAGSQLVGQSRQGAVAPKAAVKLRLDLNLEVEIAIQAKVNGDITLSLLRVLNKTNSFTTTNSRSLQSVVGSPNVGNANVLSRMWVSRCDSSNAGIVSIFTLITTNERASASDDDLLSHYLQGFRADICAQDDVIWQIKSALIRALSGNAPEILTEIFHWIIVTTLDDNHLGSRQLAFEDKRSLPFMEDPDVVKSVSLGSFPSHGLRKRRLDALVTNHARPFVQYESERLLLFDV
ncbi:hypothetical protein F5146DRAFT_1202882 [Armillaria mellea]|nr:hypothetical protein F5146DRAFT_1202882 [Armillaria mellea]